MVHGVNSIGLPFCPKTCPKICRRCQIENYPLTKIGPSFILKTCPKTCQIFLCRIELTPCTLSSEEVFVLPCFKAAELSCEQSFAIHQAFAEEEKLVKEGREEQRSRKDEGRDRSQIERRKEGRKKGKEGRKRALSRLNMRWTFRGRPSSGWTSQDRDSSHELANVTFLGEIERLESFWR